MTSMRRGQMGVNNERSHRLRSGNAGRESTMRCYAARMRDNMG